MRRSHKKVVCLIDLSMHDGHIKPGSQYDASAVSA